MKLNLGEYEWLRGAGPFALGAVPGFAGISSGRSSGMMGALLDPRITLCFQNTGREHQKSLEYLLRLEDAYEREIVWLEWRPPTRVGDPPRMFGFERVTYKTATKRSNDLIIGVLNALNAYRDSIGKPHLTPWARSRLCTAYLKHRTQAAWITSLGIEARDEFVGLRADEPDRIARLQSAATRTKGYRTPLSAAGITKAKVNAFCAAQSFDLEIEHDYQGNCTGCFLKDEADLSRAMGEEETDFDGWAELQRLFPGFGGRARPSYEQLLGERDMRLAMEAHFLGKTALLPANDGSMSNRRHHLVMLQERRRAKEGAKSISCACEQSIALGDDEDDLIIEGVG